MLRSYTHKALISFLVMVNVFSASPVAQATSQGSHVLVIYDSLAKGTIREGNLDVLERLLAAYGIQTTQTTFDHYKTGQINAYTKVITVHNATDLPITNKAFITDYSVYSGDILHIGESVPSRLQEVLGIRPQTTGPKSVQLEVGSFSQQMLLNNIPVISQKTSPYGTLRMEDGTRVSFATHEKGMAYAPYLHKGDLSELAVSSLLKAWLGVQEEGHLYLIFKEIYPFSDLDLLEQMADKLYESGIPFMVSVRPVFRNTNFPAMKRYLETLKYVQAKNGSIVVHAPVVASTAGATGSGLKQNMSDFIDSLAEYGIAPLGIGAYSYWSYDKLYTAEGMSAFDSTILFPTTEKPYREKSDTSASYSSSLYSMPLDYLRQFEYKGLPLQALPMNTAITFDFSDDKKILVDMLHQITASQMIFVDYKNTAHVVRTQSNTVVSQNGTLLINGHFVNLDPALQSVSSNFMYKPADKVSFTRLFNMQNKVLLVVIALVNIAFIGFLIIGFRLYRRKYLK
jgi:uncharacterized protein YdaL